MALPQKRCVRDRESGGDMRLSCPGSVEPGYETFCEAGFLKAMADLLEPAYSATPGGHFVPGEDNTDISGMHRRPRVRKPEAHGDSPTALS